MARSVAIIGAGQIGFAAARVFLAKGWNVRVLARSRPQWLAPEMRFESYNLGETTVPQADVVLDSIAFDAEDAARYDPEAVGRLIVVSSASVYCDGEGRTLDEAAQNGFPEFDGPIAEDQTTIAHGPDTYSTRKVRMENTARELFGDRATILRPCAIYGPHCRHPREWWFAKRLIDGRTQIPLALNGESRFQTSAADAIGRFAEFASDRGLGGVYNIADADAPCVLEIGHTIAEIWGADAQFVPVDGYPDGAVGRTPWSVPAPYLVSNEKARAAGFEGSERYAESANEAILALKNDPPQDWRAAFPQLAAYPWDMFDYEAEDRFFDERH
ncbi:MAG: reductase [Pseudomonadota bacterium]